MIEWKVIALYLCLITVKRETNNLIGQMQSKQFMKQLKKIPRRSRIYILCKIFSPLFIEFHDKNGLFTALLNKNIDIGITIIARVLNIVRFCM